MDQKETQKRIKIYQYVIKFLEDENLPKSHRDHPELVNCLEFVTQRIKELQEQLR